MKHLRMNALSTIHRKSCVVMFHGGPRSGVRQILVTCFMVSPTGELGHSKPTLSKPELHLWTPLSVPSPIPGAQAERAYWLKDKPECVGERAGEFQGEEEGDGGETIQQAFFS